MHNALQPSIPLLIMDVNKLTTIVDEWVLNKSKPSDADLIPVLYAIVQTLRELKK